MQFDPTWLAGEIPAVIAGLLGLAVIAAGLHWWRTRLGSGDARRMRARLAVVVPAEGHPATDPPGILRRIPPKSRSDLAQRTLLASAFVGRDRNAPPPE